MVSTQVFIDRLSTVMQARGLKQKDLLDACGMKDAHWYYCRHKGLPTAKVLSDLCRVLDCASDFLLDLSDEPFPPHCKAPVKENRDQGELSFDEPGKKEKDEAAA